MRVSVTHTIGDFASDLAAIPVRADRELARVVHADAIEGNELARGFASQQHTMNSDIDVPYHEAFSVERRGPMTWEYGPEDNHVKHGGSQASGYEFGSRNQAPHLDLARSVDIIGPKLNDDVSDVIAWLFW